MNTVVLFRVARTSIYNITDNPISFDKLIINVGNSYDVCNYQFVAPVSGIYFFSWSSASVANTIHNIYFQVNGVTTSWRFIYGGYFNGSDTSSQSILLPLNSGDIAKLFLASGSFYSNINYPTAFKGFLYNPKHGQNIAWTLSFPGRNYICGPLVAHFTPKVLDEGNVRK